MNGSNTSPAPWFADTGRNAVYDKRVWFDESGARFGDTPNLVVRITPQAEAESRARVFDSMANNPCMCDEVREVYRQRAFEVRVAAAKGGVA